MSEFKRVSPAFASQGLFSSQQIFTGSQWAKASTKFMAHPGPAGTECSMDNGNKPVSDPLTTDGKILGEFKRTFQLHLL